MNKIVTFTLFLFFSYKSFSQIGHIEVLVGKTESEVTKYFDSLNNLKRNPYYKIAKSVTDDGNLVFTNSFSLSDEIYYNCTGIIAKFQRNAGQEYCAEQYILGGVKFAQANLSFIKDNFTFVSVNRWEKKYADDVPFKMVVTFERKDGDFPSFVICYYLENAK